VLLDAISPREEPVTLRIETERAFREVEDLRKLERASYRGTVTVAPRDTALFRLTAGR
jgi:hypothetical protein